MYALYILRQNLIEYKNLEADVQKINQSYNKIDQKFGGKLLLAIHALHL